MASLVRHKPPSSIRNQTLVLIEQTPEECSWSKCRRKRSLLLELKLKLKLKSFFILSFELLLFNHTICDLSRAKRTLLPIRYNDV